MIKRKVCLVGAYAVGKTSLIRQFVTGVFSEDYLTTVGVKIDKRSVTVEGQEVLLMIWDLAGRDEFEAVQKSYLRGASGFLFVADGTRRDTLAEVQKEIALIVPDHPETPAILLLNKCDLENDWEVDDSDLLSFHEAGIETMVTSAMTGQNIAEAFDQLTRLMISRESGA
ncbi:MAG: GTP-binding protein [Verrucomicrobia bacterium]|nr:GTP-binding protein [Verrucomicrobiota bacterium]